MSSEKHDQRKAAPLTSTDSVAGVTRRESIAMAGKVLAGAAGLTARAKCRPAGYRTPLTRRRQRLRRPNRLARQNPWKHSASPRASFPSAPIPRKTRNTSVISCSRRPKPESHLLHTSEASLSGYADSDFKTFANYNWDALRKETAALRALAKELKLWLVLGSAHFLDEKTKPTNCLYLIDPEGKIVDRYDKCFCTGSDQRNYSVGNRLVTRDIRGVRIGLAICYDICWPQLYIAYRELGVTVMIHSFYNAGGGGANCLDTLNVHQVPTALRRQSHVGRGQQLIEALFALGIVHRPAGRHDRRAIADQSARRAGARLPRHALEGRLVSQSTADEETR